MLIYEVRLEIDWEIYAKFKLWLWNHLDEMLEVPGFLRAQILKPIENEFLEETKLNQNPHLSQPHQKKVLIIHYFVENKEVLKMYFVKFAAKMQNDGVNLFAHTFSAIRTVYEVLDKSTEL